MIRWSRAVLLGLVLLAAPASANASCVLATELRGVVSEGTASHLEDAVRAAERDGCALLVRVDTPGGMLEPTRRIVRAFLGSSAPIVTHVAPSGARAGSAGVFVVLASHVAVMAPGTSIGAAHPVSIDGSDPQGELARKVENDTAAMARGIAERRGRNAAWAEDAVRESASVTASEAHRLGVIDEVIAEERALFEAIDGREAGGVALATRDAELREHPMTIQQRVLSVLGDPTVAYALMVIGMLALMLELASPGVGVAGGVAAISFLLAAIGLGAVPVAIGGIALVALALGLFVAELYVVSYGALSLAGVACLIGGAALLVDRSDPSFFADESVRVSWGVVVPLAIVIGAAAFALGVAVRRVRARRTTTGAEGMRGELGAALSAIDLHGGTVRVHGERWRAVSDSPVEEGAPVRVVEVDGLTLRVIAADDEGALA